VTDVVAQDRKLPNLKELWQMSTTFAFVTFAWIFFRADGMNIALGYIKHIVVSMLEHPGQFLILPGGKMAFVYIIPLVLGDWYLRRDERKYRFNRIIAILLAFISIFWLIKSIGNNTSFIYFQF
jgi:hypothetical protein